MDQPKDPDTDPLYQLYSLFVRTLYYSVRGKREPGAAPPASPDDRSGGGVKRPLDGAAR